MPATAGPDRIETVAGMARSYIEQLHHMASGNSNIASPYEKNR